MTSTKIDLSFNRIARVGDLSDLSETLFPGNRNQQHAFLAIYLAIKWSERRFVTDLGDVAREHAISRRTLERVRAKMRRMGLIDRVSRFNTRFGGSEGWILSSRFERSLTRLASQAANFRVPSSPSKDKDQFHLALAKSRCNAGCVD